MAVARRGCVAMLVFFLSGCGEYNGYGERMPGHLEARSITYFDCVAQPTVFYGETMSIPRAPLFQRKLLAFDSANSAVNFEMLLGTTPGEFEQLYDGNRYWRYPTQDPTLKNALKTENPPETRFSKDMRVVTEKDELGIADRQYLCTQLASAEEMLALSSEVDAAQKEYEIQEATDLPFDVMMRKVGR